MIDCVLTSTYSKNNVCICNHARKGPFTSLDCLLQRVDTSLLGNDFPLSETLPLSQKSQSEHEAKRGLQLPTGPKTTCYLFANKGSGAEGTGRKSVTSVHPFAAFHGLVQPHAQAQTQSESTQLLNACQPQTWARSAGNAGSESKLAPSPHPQKHFFPISGGAPQQHQAQPLRFPGLQPQLQPTNSFCCHWAPATTATNNMPGANSAFHPGGFGTGTGAATPKTGGLFGGGPATSGGFGTKTENVMSGGGLFGQSTANNTAGGGLFGQPTTKNNSGSLFGQPATNNTSGNLFGQPAANNTSGGGLFGKPSGGLFGFGNNPEHFEAYVLHTHASSTKDSTTWSYKAEPLLLDDAAMQAHIFKVGSTHSILDSISLLQPQQLHLVQEQVQARQGKLVSVQFGAAAELPTPMGSLFRISPVIFLLKTSMAKIVPQQAVQHSCWGPPPATAAQPTTLFGNNATTVTSNTGGLFGRRTVQANDWLDTGSQTGNTGGGGFGRPTNDSVHSQGDELCTLAVKDGTTTTSVHMVLPAYFDNSGKSFEEARAQDIANGFVFKPAPPQPGPQSLFGITAVKDKLGFGTASGGDEAGSSSKVPAPTPHYGGWGQKAELGAFGASKSPFATLLNEAKGQDSSPFASTNSNPRPNPFAASTTPTKLPPSPFAQVSQGTTAAGFGQGQSSAAPGMASEHSADHLNSSTKADEKSHLTPSLFWVPPPSTLPKPTASLFGSGAAADARKTTPSLFGTGAELTPSNPTTSLFGSAPTLPSGGSLSGNLSKPSLFGKGAAPKPTPSNPAPTHPAPGSSDQAPIQPASPASKQVLVPSLFGAGSTPWPNKSTSFAVPDEELSKLFIEQHKARVAAAKTPETEEKTEEKKTCTCPEKEIDLYVDDGKIVEMCVKCGKDIVKGEEVKENKEGGVEANEEEEKHQERKDGGGEAEEAVE